MSRKPLPNTDDTVSDLRERAFADVTFPYLRLDATYIKARDGGRVPGTAVVTAIGAGADGYRRLLGLDAIDTESYAGWLGFLRSLRERGVRGVLCVTSDARDGLWRAIEEVFPGSAWQRCAVHLMRSACSLAPTRGKRAASALRPAGFSRMRSPMPWRTWTSPIPTT